MIRKDIASKKFLTYDYGNITVDFVIWNGQKYEFGKEKYFNIWYRY